MIRNIAIATVSLFFLSACGGGGGSGNTGVMKKNSG
jgi:hypothetical protein